MFCNTVTNVDLVATRWWSALLLQMVDLSQQSHTSLREGFKSLSKVLVALLDLRKWKNQNYLWESFEKPYPHGEKKSKPSQVMAGNNAFSIIRQVFFQKNKTRVSLLVQMELS